MTLLVFPFLRVGGMQLFRTESSDRSDKLFGRAKDLAATIATVYAALTTISAVVFHSGGLTLVRCDLPTACRRFRPAAFPPGMPPSRLSRSIPICGSLSSA